nr:JmjC domain-containing protein [Tanacetum cinerariifolium]
MAAKRYRDEHNKVGFLLKPIESDDYHQIIDFLRASHIRYALTHDLIIFDSLANNSGLRLRLADDGGIDDFPIVEIYSGMDNLGLNFEGHPMPLLAAMLSQDQEGKGAGHGQSSDPNIASFSRTHKTDYAPFTNVEDAPLGGSFHMSPPRSTQAPPVGHTSGGVEDLITLTALFSVVSTLVQKVHSLETELKDHKKLFKDVVGKLVKNVKAMEVRLRKSKKKMLVSDSGQEEGGKQDVDLDALLALANAAVTVDSNLSPGGASDNPDASTSVPADIPTGASNVPTGSTSVPADAPAGVSNKGKAPMVEEDIPIKGRTLKQIQEDILGEQVAKRLHDAEQAQVDRQRAERQRRRQQEVLASAMYYTEADWINIMAQVEANVSLSKILLGDDVSEDNFPARMAALIKRKKQALAEKLAQKRKDRPMSQGQQRNYMRQFVKNQSCAVYSTGWSMAYVKSFIDDQLKEEFEKIQKAISNISIQAFSKTLKRTCPVLEEPSSKRKKSTEAPIPSVSAVPQSPVTFIKVVSDEDSEDEAPRLWSALVGWEYYENHPVAGARLILWGDLQVLFDSYEGADDGGIDDFPIVEIYSGMDNLGWCRGPYYTVNIMAQVEANVSLSKILLGNDVSEDNFPARMAALSKRKKQALAEKLAQKRKDRPMSQGQQRNYMRQFVKNQSCVVYSTGWSMAYVKSFIDDQLKEEFEKIQKAISNISIQAFSKTLKRTGPVLEEPSSKRKKSTEAPIPSVSATFIKVVSDEDSEDEAPRLWYALVGWEVITTPPGDINTLYRIDWSTAYFTTLREILHMVDRHDLVKLVEMVINSPWIMPILGTKELASFEQTAPDFSSILVKTQSSRYVVPTGRVVVPTGRYVVPAGRVVVPTGRYVVSAGRVVVSTGKYVVPAGIVVIFSPGRIQIVIPG